MPNGSQVTRQGETHGYPAYMVLVETIIVETEETFHGDVLVESKKTYFYENQTTICNSVQSGH